METSASALPSSSREHSIADADSRHENCSSSRPREPPPNRLVFEPIYARDISFTGSPPLPKGTVLMLHGWAQNVHVFSNRSKKLLKRMVRAGYRVVFLQAPHRLPPKKEPATPILPETNNGNNNGNNNNSNASASREFAYAWFVYNKEDPSADTTPLPSPTGDFNGMNESLQVIKSEIERLYEETAAPVFLLGFSQGAVLVHKVATLACQETPIISADDSTAISSSQNPFSRIEKCILVSGFSFQERSSVLQHERNYHKVIPSLHVWGTQDTRVPPYLTRQVFLQDGCFQGKHVVWEHPRGHVLPTDRTFCDFVLRFLSGQDTGSS
jgi:predicted esterase